jgi:hypothetical protein
MSISTLGRNRQNHPQKRWYPSLRESGHDLTLAEKWKARRYDRKRRKGKQNRKEGQSLRVLKAALRNPTFVGDVTYK